MPWIKTATPRRIILASAIALLTAACGGGGGDNNPTDPGNQNGGDAVNFDLVALGFAGLPADTQIEDCKETRFFGGTLHLDATGKWQMKLKVHDDTGDWGSIDSGQFEQDGSTMQFTSQYSGASYQGSFNGTELKIMYDWCFNGVPDVQLVFDK
jgi:hypothetical protein